jgi:hypothetical protein
MNENQEYGWGKLAIFVFCVLLPAIGVGISNYIAYPESFWLATILLAVTVGIAGVVAWYSGDATAKVARYCIILHLTIGVVLAINLASHFILAREVSGARMGVQDRHVEEDRQNKFREDETARKKQLLAEQRELEKERARALRMEAIRNDSARRLGYRPPIASNPIPASTVNALPVPTAAVIEEAAKPSVKRMSPEEVLGHWRNWLTAWAFVDMFISILGGLILVGRWEWDTNHNGIPDNIEKLYFRNPEMVRLQHPQYYSMLAAMYGTPQAPRQPITMAPRAEDDLGKPSRH